MTEQTIEAALSADTSPAMPNAAVETPQAAVTADAQSGGLEKADKQDVTPTPEKPKEKSDVDKAFDAMRKQIRELKRQVTVAGQPKQEAQPIPDPVTDLEGFNRDIDQKLRSTQAQANLAASVRYAQKQYSDYAEIEEAFVEMAQENPALADAMWEHDDPAEFVYKYTKEAKARAEIGDPVQYGEKIRKETTEKLMADIDKMVEAKLKERLSGILPSSLAGEQTKGSRITNPTGFNGPTPLSDILKMK